MSSGLSNQKDEMTVGKLKDLLSDIPDEMPLYFGLKLLFDDEVYDQYGSRTTVEFDDWLEFDHIENETQILKTDECKIETRVVTVIEMKY